MGQLKIVDREWIRDNEFWFALDGEVTIETRATTTKSPETHTSQCWQIRKTNQNGKWYLHRSNLSQTRDHRDNALNVYPDNPKRVLCLFTAQIVEYHKPVVFSPHSEQLEYETVPKT